MFTFVVTCYNQAKVVPFALESIKYQIRRFGKGQQFQLVITDDGSEDHSCEVIEEWLEKARGLFVRADRLFRKKNAGICQNYVDALKTVEGDCFIVLNGDDLLAPYNLFEITAKLEEYDIICTAFLKFTGSGRMIRSHRTYLEVVLQEFIRGGTLRRAIRLGCPIMGTAVYRKSLLSDEVFDFILRFRTVNDRACFQKILDLNPSVRTCYVNRPFILYRISTDSVSNFSSPGRRLHCREIAQLCRAEREAEKSAFFRAVLYLQEQSTKVRASSSYLIRLLRFCSPYFAIMLRICILHYGKIRKMERQLVDRHWKCCRNHYRKIMKVIDCDRTAHEKTAVKL